MCIDRFNTSVRAYDKSKKAGMKTFEHIKDINDAKKDIEDARKAIKDYIVNKLNITTEVKQCQR